MSEEFISYLRYEKRYSPHTVKSYRTDLRDLSDYLRLEFEIENPANADAPALRSWIVSLMEAEISVRTIRRKVSAVRAYFKWLKKFHGVRQDPTLRLVIPKAGEKLPVFVDEETMESLRIRDFGERDDPHMRQSCMFEMLYQTGMRSAELIGLKIRDVDFESGTIKVLGKRNKERVIPVNDELMRLMKIYLRQRKELDPEGIVAEFFITDKGRKLYPRFVYDTVNTYLGRVSSLHKKSPHILRHTFATHMLNRGANINAIKELLGHASLAATQVYTHNGIGKLIEVHKKAHPKG